MSSSPLPWFYGDQTGISIVLETKPSAVSSEKPSNRSHRALLGVSVALGALSLIPPLRFVGALALRSVSFLSASASCSNRWGTDNLAGRAVKCIRIAAVGVGLVGVAASSPATIIASLATEIALQIFDAAKAFYRGDWPKGLAHCSFVVINTLALAAVATGGWQLAVAAASISAAAMVAIGMATAMTARSDGDVFESGCYFALAALGVASAISAAQITSWKKVKCDYSFKNTSKFVAKIWSDRTPNAKCVAKLLPGEKIEFSLPPIGHRDAVYVTYDGPAAPHNEWGSWVYDPVIVKNPIAAKDIPLLPITSTAVVTDL